MQRPFLFLAISALVVLGGLLRLYRIGEKGFWWDEVRAMELAAAPGFQDSLPVETEMDPAPQLRARFALSSFGDSLRGLRETFHPPLFSLILHQWFRLTGGSEEEVLRLPVALFGTLAIPLIFLLGTKLFSPGVGAMGAFLFAISPFQIYFSQELRSYTLWVLLALASYLSLLFLFEPHRRWMPFLLGSLLAAAAYTHYFALFLPLSQGLYVATSRRARPYRREWLKALVTAAAGIVLYLPWLMMIQHKTTPSIWVWEGPLLPQLLESLFSLPVKLLLGPDIGFLFYGLPRFQQTLWILGAVIWAAPWFYGFLQWLKADPDRADRCRLLLLWLAVPMAVLLFADLARHSVILSLSRYFAFATPALLLLVSAGLLGLRRPLRACLSLCLIVTFSLLLLRYYHDPIKQQDWRGLSAFLKTHASPSDLLVFNQVGRPPWLASLNTLCLTYYQGTEGHPIYLTGETLSVKTLQLLERRRRFWLIPQNRFFNEPGSSFTLTRREEFEGVGSVALFEKGR